MLTEEDSVWQTVSETSSLYKCVDNKVQFGEMESETRTEKTAPEQGLHAPYTEKWMVCHITEDDPLRVRTHLRQWISEKRHLEIDEGLIQHLKELPRDELEKALKELRGKRKFVKGYKGNQISIPVTIQTEDMVTQFTQGA